MKKKQEKKCEWWKVLILLTFIISLFILSINIFEIKEVDKLYSDKIILKSRNIFGNYYDIEQAYKSPKKYSCSSDVIVSDFRENFGNMFFEVEGKGKRGECVLIFEKKVKKLIFANSLDSEQEEGQ